MNVICTQSLCHQCFRWFIWILKFCCVKQILLRNLLSRVTSWWISYKRGCLFQSFQWIPTSLRKTESFWHIFVVIEMYWKFLWLWTHKTSHLNLPPLPLPLPLPLLCLGWGMGVSNDWCIEAFEKKLNHQRFDLIKIWNKTLSQKSNASHLQRYSKHAWNSQFCWP